MDLAAAGTLAIGAAFGAACWSLASSVIGIRRSDPRFTSSGRRALIVCSAITVLATALLIVALYTRDFSIGYVASYSSRSTSTTYTFTALWAGMEGSLLFWTMLSSLYCAGSLIAGAGRRKDLAPIATAIFAAVLLFFLGLLAFSAGPFDRTKIIPSDGSGLTPLLQSPFMAIHPVLLYLGLTGFIVPFGFAAASLVRGKLDTSWFTATRRWTVLAWSFLTIGILLGSAWAYMELGWGGYWAWDPVENASLLPWLTGTAFLHSVMIQERRGMLKIWNVGLVLGTYCLAIFGTFLTRSGLLASVHTFSESPVGKYLLPLLGLILVGSFGLLGYRIDQLRSRRHIDSMLSREAMFMFNNLLFVALAFTVLWGTLYPVLVEAIQGVQVSVGPPFYNTVAVPTGLALLALTGIGPLVAWRKGSFRNLKRQFTIPGIVGAVVTVSLGVAGMRSAGALLALGLCAFVATVTIGEFYRGARAQMTLGAKGLTSGLIKAVSRSRRRYGGYIVHLGVVLIFIGLSGNVFQKSWTGTLQPGETFRLGRFDVRYVQSRSFPTEEKMINMALVEVSESGKRVATLRPQRNFHLAQRQAQSEIGLRTTLSEDFYIVLTRLSRQGGATFKAWVNPLVAWIWIGGAMMAAGMIVLLSSKPPSVPTSPTPKAAPEKEPAEALV